MENCCVCQKPKATLVCGSCESSVCKYCAQFLDEDQFIYMTDVPADLKHTTYCGPCFDSKVQPAISEYEKIVEKAKNITVYFTADSKITRNFKRNEKPYKVKDCAEKEEVVMKLAFLAVKGNFNAIIDVDVKYEKILMGTYQTTKWSGTAMPAQITSARLL